MNIKQLSTIVFFLVLSGLLGEKMDWQQYVPQNNSGRVSYGPTQCGKETLPSLTVYGPATLNGTTITENTVINGVLEASQAVFNKITVNGDFQGTNVKIKEGAINGSMKLKKSEIDGIIQINGLLTAVDSEFKDKILIDTTELFLSSSKIKDVIVKNSPGNYSKQTVYLQEKTVVTGSITFNSGKGEVVLSGGTEIQENQVHGGKIIRK